MLKKQSDHSNPKIINIMADGTVRDSVKGYLTNVDQIPETARRLIYEMIMSGREIIAKKK